MRWGDFEGASEVAKRLECTCLLALSDSDTPPGSYRTIPAFGKRPH